MRALRAERWSQISGYYGLKDISGIAGAIFDQALIQLVVRLMIASRMKTDVPSARDFRLIGFQLVRSCLIAAMSINVIVPLDPVLAQVSSETHLRNMVSSSDNVAVLAKLEALLKGPDASNPEAQFYYGRTLQRLGKFERAKAAYKKSLELDPDNWTGNYCRDNLRALDARSANAGNSKSNYKGYLGILLDSNLVKNVVVNSPAAIGRIASATLLQKQKSWRF